MPDALRLQFAPDSDGSPPLQRGLLMLESVIEIADLAKTLGCFNGTRWLKISSLRVDRDNQSPVGWTDVYVDPQYAEIGELVRASPDTLISTLIEHRYGRRVAEIRQVVRAMTITEPLAQSLQVKAGMAGLEILRQYFDSSGQIFEVSVTIHPSDRFAVAMRLQRSEA